MVYIDEEYKCYTSNPDGVYREIDKPLFEGKCDTFIEGHRYLPPGESWTREDGTVFCGEMIAPWRDYNALDAIQREYEKEKLKDAENALAILLGGEAT